VTDPSGPAQPFGSRVSEAGPLARHVLGMQNVNPDARTWRHDESTGPTAATRHGAIANGAVDGGEWVQATMSAKERMGRSNAGLGSRLIGPPKFDRRLTDRA